MSRQHDVVIVGAGMVGASLAVALRDTGLDIAVVEAVAASQQEQPSYDARAIALSHGSQRILDNLGLWSALQAEMVTPITGIQVSDRGHFGAVRMDAEEEGVEALGYVVEASVLGRVLQPTLAQQSGLTLYCPATIEDVRQHSQGLALQLQHADGTIQLQTRLLVAADGGQSTIAALLGGDYRQRGYGQSAIIANVVGDRPHAGMAYERFTDTGPLALLPNQAPAWMEGSEAGQRRWSLVWTVRDEQLQEHLQLDDAAFVARLQSRLGRRAGRILAAGPRRAYPLGLRFLRDYTRERVVFIGNAAHTIHPVAGQGLNLGLRDVATLSELLEMAQAGQQDLGGQALLARYRELRQTDYRRVTSLTDALARGFASQLLPLVVTRNLAMIGMDLLPPLRRMMTRQMMGLTGWQSRLARGAPCD